MDKENPRKFDPVSPINVFAGEKLNGKNPTSAPASAVIKTIDTSGEPFKTNITNNDTADMTEIPAANPSKPSIRLMQFIIDTINIIVNGY